jgi:hypothetical protein
LEERGCDLDNLTTCPCGLPGIRIINDFNQSTLRGLWCENGPIIANAPQRGQLQGNHMAMWFFQEKSSLFWPEHRTAKKCSTFWTIKDRAVFGLDTLRRESSSNKQQLQEGTELQQEVKHQNIPAALRNENIPVRIKLG